MTSVLQSLSKTVHLSLGIAILLLLGLHFFGDGFAFDRYFFSWLFRYLHVLTGIMWIGLLWYFNFVQIPSMPKGSYSNLKSAKKNAILLMRKTNCDAVKIESNNKNFGIIRSLVKYKIPVMGHIGFTPQFKKKFKIEGDSKKKANKLLKEAKNIEKAGAFSIVLECINPKASKLITSSLKIPTIGIGSSNNCDGQILVTDDMLGISGFYPKFVKKYLSLDRIIEKAIKKYTRDVKLKKFPSKKNFLNGSRHR